MPMCACLGSQPPPPPPQKAAMEKDNAKNTAQSSTPVVKPSQTDTRKKVYVTRGIHEDAITILKEKYNVEVWQSEHKVPREKLINDVKGASAIICTIADSIDGEILDAAGPALKVIGSMAADLTHIDVDACKSKDVKLHHVADLCADVTAELTCSLLLVTCKRLLEGEEAVKNGEWGLWRPMWILGSEFSGRTLGILGFGRVGLGVARRFQPFGLARIIYFDKQEHPQAGEVSAQLVTSEELFSDSDYIVCCLALNKETFEFINSVNLSLCKPECVLVNTARAEVINQDHLLACLQSGGLAGVGLDVTMPEPLPPTHPLLSEPRCVILPHMGTATTATRKRMAVNLANLVVDELN